MSTHIGVQHGGTLISPDMCFIVQKIYVSVSVTFTYVKLWFICQRWGIYGMGWDCKGPIGDLVSHCKFSTNGARRDSKWHKKNSTINI